MRIWIWILLWAPVALSSMDYLWDATFEGDDLRVEHLLELKEDDLINAGSFQVDPQRIEAEKRRTALMMCGYSEGSADSEKLDKKCAAIGRMLVEAGANASHVDDYGWDALSMASVKGFTNFCRYLVNQPDVDIDRVDDEGRSAIMKAAGHGHVKTVIMFWKHGADMEALDPQGMTILQQVVTVAMSDLTVFPLLKEILETILDPKPVPPKIESEDKIFREPGKLSVDETDKHGRTALHYAVIADHREAVLKLLEFGADPTLQDNFGVTALTMVRGHANNEGMTEILTTAAAEYAVRRHERWLRNTEGEL